MLQKDKEVKQRGLQHFFHYQGPTNSSATADVKGGGGFNEVVKTISTQAFFQREVFEKHSYSLPTDETNRTKLLAATEKCDIRELISKQENTLLLFMFFLLDTNSFLLLSFQGSKVPNHALFYMITWLRWQIMFPTGKGNIIV